MVTNVFKSLVLPSDQNSLFKSIAERIDARAKYIRHWPLTGGVSAQIEALDLNSQEESADR